MFVITFERKFKDANYESHWNILVFCDEWNTMSDLNMSHEKMSDFVSLLLFGFLSVTKLRNFDVESRWNTLIFFDKKVYAVRFEYVPWKNVWFCFIFIVWIHLSYKTEKFWFSKSLKYFNFFFFLDKKWRQIWLRPVKQYLFWFKLCCLSRMLVINWEIWILNFIEIVYIFELRNLVPDRNLPQFFCLNCILWHYYRNCFELKMFLIILRFIEILYRKFCIWRAVSGCWPRTNE